MCWGAGTGKGPGVTSSLCKISKSSGRKGFSQESAWPQEALKSRETGQVSLLMAGAAIWRLWFQLHPFQMLTLPDWPLKGIGLPGPDLPGAGSGLRQHPLTSAPSGGAGACLPRLAEPGEGCCFQQTKHRIYCCFHRPVRAPRGLAGGVAGTKGP